MKFLRRIIERFDSIAMKLSQEVSKIRIDSKQMVVNSVVELSISGSNKLETERIGT